MPLDYPHTCPNIDRVIDEVRDTLRKDLSADIKDQISGIVDASIEFGLDNIIAEVESLRAINEDMRSAADEQIRNLESDVEYWQEKVEDLGIELQDANDALIEYQNQTDE